MRTTSSLFAVALLAVAGFCHATPDNGGKAANAETVLSDPSFQAQSQAYLQAMNDALATSTDPHDWVLASITNLSILSSHREAANRLLQRAAQALPDDASTQWLTVQFCDSAKRDADCDNAVSALERIEPDNAAVWMQSLQHAARHSDTVGVEVALEHMVASTHFDDHVVDVREKIVAAYQRFPLPEHLVARIRDMGPGITAQNFPYVMAGATANAIALPAYQHLIRACTIDAQRGLHAGRKADCAKIGRMLATQGPNLVANRIGFALLRVSHTFNDADVQSARALDWVMAHYPKSGANEPATAIIDFSKDWIATGSEFGALRLAMQRANIAMIPPADWVDEQSPFSERRVQEDQRRATERTAETF